MTKAPKSDFTYRERLEQFFEASSYFSDLRTQILDKNVAHGKEVASFYERMMLISLGTIGLSVTALTSMASKVAPSPTLKHLFGWFIAPAWISLLVSIVGCRVVMAMCLNQNKHSIDEWAKQSVSYAINILIRVVRNLATAIPDQTTAKDLSDKVEGWKVALLKLEELKATEIPSSVGWYSTLSIVTMQGGLILLCVAAIKLFNVF